MRNHGDSSHHPTHTYSALAEDVELFIKQHKLHKPALIGHSMGAKTVMTVALRDRMPISDLIPVDSAPADAALSSDFPKYMQAMRRIEDSDCTKQSDADKILQEYEESLTIRQFLLANLMRRKEDGLQKFRIPVKILSGALDHVADFPFTDPDVTRFEGPMLMVRGTQSQYVADEMLPIVGRFFPNFQLADIDAGHWVIAEKPKEFKDGESFMA